MRSLIEQTLAAGRSLHKVDKPELIQFAPTLEQAMALKKEDWQLFTENALKATLKNATVMALECKTGHMLAICEAVLTRTIKEALSRKMKLDYDMKVIETINAKREEFKLLRESTINNLMYKHGLSEHSKVASLEEKYVVEGYDKDFKNTKQWKAITTVAIGLMLSGKTPDEAAEIIITNSAFKGSVDWLEGHADGLDLGQEFSNLEINEDISDPSVIKEGHSYKVLAQNIPSKEDAEKVKRQYPGSSAVIQDDKDDNGKSNSEPQYMVIMKESKVLRQAVNECGNTISLTVSDGALSLVVSGGEMHQQEVIPVADQPTAEKLYDDKVEEFDAVEVVESTDEDAEYEYEAAALDKPKYSVDKIKRWALNSDDNSFKIQRIINGMVHSGAITQQEADDILAARSKKMSEGYETITKPTTKPAVKPVRRQSPLRPTPNIQPKPKALESRDVKAFLAKRKNRKQK